ncbi:MAG: anion transporter [Nitrospirae bacterium]|nr:anion transporter [Nitrospirota bacterium]
METAVLIIFIATYAGIALGGIPGLALDRTGVALLGAIAMIVIGELTPEQAIGSIDVSTILLLYGLMVISSQLRLGGFYTWVSAKIVRFVNVPDRFLMVMMLVSALLSACLANDIICLAFTPVLTFSLLEAGLNPVPFLIGLAVSSNIGSAATIIGNPQNMLIGQLGGLKFAHFFFWCAPPSVLSLAAAYIIIRISYRGNFYLFMPVSVGEQQWPAFDRHQSTKGIWAVAVLVVLFFTEIPRELTAITIAGLLLCSRKIETRSILGSVDWHLITLFCALFIVIKGVELIQLPSVFIKLLNSNGIDIHNLFTLTIVSAIFSNLFSNVPATMLLTKFLSPDDHLQWYVLALSSTFAGNLITIGSIANLITIEGAKKFGVVISFKEHAKTGIPVTVVSLLITLIWIGIFR